jgi:hypothetical protein
MKYEVKYEVIIKRTITSIVEAENKKEAILKAKDGDVIGSDEDNCPEEIISFSNESAEKIK